MGTNAGLTFVSIFLFVILYVGLLAIGLFIMYLIIKWAIDKSQVNDRLAAIQHELNRLNSELNASRQLVPGDTDRQDT